MTSKGASLFKHWELLYMELNLGRHLPYNHRDIFSSSEGVCLLTLQVIYLADLDIPQIQQMTYSHSLNVNTSIRHSNQFNNSNNQTFLEATEEPRTLPCFWCVKICPIHLHQCLQKPETHSWRQVFQFQVWPWEQHSSGCFHTLAHCLWSDSLDATLNLKDFSPWLSFFSSREKSRNVFL